ncbi:MAG: 4-hydroxy-tetrahydrodipicolinate reductase [Prevotellaceae bacterium]|jgi:4-hydroxy-tetrahydrodipicolinate reductase|nr:4-hydroxy-tetrahydrodipicolinate reductase [Prevotellaceae bacterium]
MKIALIGYGKMGRTVERFALQRGHEITSKIDKDNTEDIYSDAFRYSDAAIEFSCPEAAFANVSASLKLGVPVVCGTTGWREKLDEAKLLCAESGTGFIHSSNFSLGVNIFFYINRRLAESMKNHRNYVPSIRELHHIHKKDAPSGTAITLADDIAGILGLSGWALDACRPDVLRIAATREGEAPGTHEVAYESETDSIVIRHEARSRDGFALGAVVAAEFIAGKRGVFDMGDVLGLGS